MILNGLLTESSKSSVNQTLNKYKGHGIREDFF